MLIQNIITSNKNIILEKGVLSYVSRHIVLHNNKYQTILSYNMVLNLIYKTFLNVILSVIADYLLHLLYLLYIINILLKNAYKIIMMLECINILIILI